MSPVGTGSESSPGRRTFLARVIVGTQAAIAAAITAVVGGAALAPSFMPGRRSWLRAAMVADLTAGYTPVRIERLLDEALIVALRDNRIAMHHNDVIAAQMITEVGVAQEVGYHPDERRRVVGLRSAGGEDHFLRLATDQFRHLPPRVFHGQLHALGSGFGTIGS